MDLAGEIALRLAPVRERIASAARRAGRDPSTVTLIGVTKTHGPEVVTAATEAGLRDVGENRVQEALEKMPRVVATPPPRWHLIGHLQRNKARRAATAFDLIHSLDSLRLAESLDRYVREDSPPELPRRLPVLLQISLAGETQKEGFDLPGGLQHTPALRPFYADVEAILRLPALDVQGVMTIAPFVADPEEARPVFRMLRALRDELAKRYPQAAWRELSMGMSNDFEVAVEEGATLVRVGRAIFGERG
jgi:hypothetical protein